MLLLDEPTAQSACATPIAGCPITGTGGINLYDGSPGHPNIFQAQQISPNTLAWYNLPLDAPGQTATHILRITNVRVNANAAAVSTGLQPSAIQATIAISSPLSIGLAAPTQIVANTQSGLQTSFQGTTLQQCGQSPLTAGLYPNPASITFTEGFPGAFKSSGFTGASPPPGGQPGGAIFGGETLAQWISTQDQSESGFAPVPGAGLPQLTGAANTGTVLAITFTNLPAQVTFTAPQQISLLDSKGNVAGTAITTSNSGAVTGGASVMSPNALYVLIGTVTEPTALKSITIPFTFSGVAPSLPLTISATAGFYDSPSPQINLYAVSATTSIPVISIPVFGSLDSGISTPPAAPAQPVATVADCTQTTPSLGTNGQPLAVFQITGPVTPRVYNVPLLSSGPPVSNLQLIKDPSATWLNATLSSTTTPASILLSANPETANFNTSLQVLTTAPVGAVALPVSFSYVQGPWFTRYGFTNSASYVAQAVAPGEPFLIGGYNFSTVAESNLTLGANGFVTTTLGGVQVMFDSVPAPLQFTVNINGTGYVAGYVPFELANQATTNVHLIYNGAPSPPVTLNVINAVPAIFSVSTTGGGQGAILNQDFSLNGQGNGALPGQLVYIYGGGAGQTTPPGRTGGVTGVGAPVANLNLPVTVFIDGVEATDVPYAGPAPSLIEGVFQVNVRIPSNARTGASLPVVIQVGDKVTQPGVTVYVQ